MQKSYGSYFVMQYSSFDKEILFFYLFSGIRDYN